MKRITQQDLQSLYGPRVTSWLVLGATSWLKASMGFPLPTSRM